MFNGNANSLPIWELQVAMQFFYANTFQVRCFNRGALFLVSAKGNMKKGTPSSKGKRPSHCFVYMSVYSKGCGQKWMRFSELFYLKYFVRGRLVVYYILTHSFLFNTSHGILIQEILILPPNPFIQGWSLSKSLQCLLLQTGLKPFLVTTSKKFWCHCYYIYRGILSGFFLRFWGPNSKPMNFLTNIGIFSLT